MKLSGAAVLTALCVAASSVPSSAFTPSSLQAASFVPSSSSTAFVSSSRRSAGLRSGVSSLNMAYKVGIVGATGAVGKEIRQCLKKREFPVESLRIFGSTRSAGKDMDGITVELFDRETAKECDVLFLAVSGDFSKEHAKALTEGDNGCVVIDNSSAFRYNPEIPLVVPEINGAETKKSKLIANPNCTTAIGLMALWPLLKKFGCKRVLMSTYQAASGAGQPGMDEVQEGTRAYLNGEKVENKIFAHPLPFNVIPQIDVFQENGYTKEEMKVTWETRKICGLADDFPVSCSAVRIPTIRAHSEVIVMETEQPVDVAAAQQALDEAPGVDLVDDPSKLLYPMPLTATGKYNVEVGRVRKSLVFGDYGLEFFVSGDQLLRGAALNAVLVAEEMIANGSL